MGGRRGGERGGRGWGDRSQRGECHFQLRGQNEAFSEGEEEEKRRK